MKKVLLSLILSSVAFLSDAQYSDSDFDGPWFVLNPIDSVYSMPMYMILDGNGSITDFGMMDDNSSPQGSYSVDTDGSFTGSLTIDGFPAPFWGNITDANNATFTIYAGDTIGPWDMIRVTDPSAMAGNWQGTLTEDSTGTTKNVEFVVDQTGEIVDVIGMKGPFYGRLYKEQQHIAGHVHTGELDAYSQIQFQIGIEQGTTIYGRYGLDCNDCPGGDYVLTNITASTNNLVQNKIDLNVYPNPIMDEMFLSLDGLNSTNCTIRVFDLLGKEVYSEPMSGIGKTSTIKIDNISWPSGLYMLQVTTYNQTSTIQFYVE